jgi:hypothetical protein
MAKQGGRDGRAIRDVDISSEALEVERRAYHERIRRERERPVEEALEDAGPQLERKGWRVITEGEEKR